ncbi:hypothetical protein [Cohnella soli]|uniref:Uncharacterized protein n=1 Tax=Cohnella soli TaxID=425005 RepID=A0ABW0HQZ7_9BACL
MNYLSDEEQFKDILNNEEISRIRDPLLRAIRMKYWSLRHEAFLDERNIPDSDLEKVYDEIKHKEQEEIQRFKHR